MGDKTEISWTTNYSASPPVPGATFNCWWGCLEVSPGCANCYAKVWDKRMGGDHWGHLGPRKMMSEKYWAQLEKWNRDAARGNYQKFVFVASMADLFEDHPAVVEARKRFLALTERLPHLVFLLLTKRIQNVRSMVPAHWLEGHWPKNVWLGTTVEDSKRYHERVPIILEFAGIAPKLFLSCEPLVGPVDFHDPVIYYKDGHPGTILPLNGEWRPAVGNYEAEYCNREFTDIKLAWVIVGGESGIGDKIRPMHPKWEDDIREACQEAGVDYYFKQWGRYLPVAAPHLKPGTDKPYRHVVMYTDGEMKEATWEDAMFATGDWWAFADVGKGLAGSEVYGRQYHGQPQPYSPSEVMTHNYEVLA